jgi:hypothetical protein
VLDTRTGELVEQELVHEGDAVERFYRALPPPVTILPPLVASLHRVLGLPVPH